MRCFGVYFGESGVRPKGRKRKEKEKKKLGIGFSWVIVVCDRREEKPLTKKIDEKKKGTKQVTGRQAQPQTQTDTDRHRHSVRTKRRET